MKLNSISISIVSTVTTIATCAGLLTSNVAFAKTSNISSVIYGHAPIGSLSVEKTIAPGGTAGKLQPGSLLTVSPSLTDEDGDSPAPYIVQYQRIKKDKDNPTIVQVEKDGWKTLDTSSPMPITIEDIGSHIVMKFVPTTLTGIPSIGTPKYWSSSSRVIDGDITIDIEDPSGAVEPVLPSEGTFSISLQYVSGDTFTKVATSPGLYPKDGSDLNPIVGSVWRSVITCEANILPSACTPDNFTYQWKVETDAGSVNASGIGATTDSYTIDTSEQGMKVFVEVNPKVKLDIN